MCSGRASWEKCPCTKGCITEEERARHLGRRLNRNQGGDQKPPSTHLCVQGDEKSLVPPSGEQQEIEAQEGGGAICQRPQSHHPDELRACLTPAQQMWSELHRGRLPIQSGGIPDTEV